MKCFVLNKELPNVIAAHIVPRRASDHDKFVRSVFGQEFGIGSPRNGLLLYKSLEHAMDVGSICFVKRGHEFVLKVLEQDILDVNIVEKTRELIETDPSKRRKFCPIDDDEINRLTFRDLDGTAVLHIPPELPVYKRALCFQAKWSSARAAVECEEYWSDGYNKELMERFLRDTLGGCAPP